MMGVACFFCLIDSPALSFRWLDADEIRFLELRQCARRMQGSHKSTERKKTMCWDALWAVMTDWKIYLLILVNWSNAVPSKHIAFATSFQNAKKNIQRLCPQVFHAPDNPQYGIYVGNRTAAHDSTICCWRAGRLRLFRVCRPVFMENAVHCWTTIVFGGCILNFVHQI